jgi:hypothetical protein
MKQEQVKTHIKRLTNLDGNKEKMYSIVWGQCSNALQEVIKTDDVFAQKDTNFDCIWLLQKCKMAAAGLTKQTSMLPFSNQFYISALSNKHSMNQMILSENALILPSSHWN